MSNNIGGHQRCLVNEAESVRFPGTTATKNPGPGYYDPNVEKIGAHHKVSSTEGTFPRDVRREPPKSFSPGPKYNPTVLNIGHGPRVAMGTANRFGAPKPTPDFTYPGELPSPTSLAGTLGKSSRNAPALGSPSGPISPGPKYNIRKSLVQGHKKSFLPKADRFPPVDDRSPGPVYLPKYNVGPNAGPKFSRERRDKTFFNPDAEAAPGPAAYVIPPPQVPAHSFGIKPELWSKPLSDAPGCTHYVVKDTYARKVNPAYSFAAPDPEVLALFKQQRGTTVQTSVKSEHDKDSGSAKGKATKPGANEPGTNEGENVDTNSQGEGEETKEANRHAVASSLARRFPSRNTFIITMGMESPGPAHYMNIHKLFDHKPGPKSVVFNSRRELPPQKAPGPLSYRPEKYDPNIVSLRRRHLQGLRELHLRILEDLQAQCIITINGLRRHLFDTE